MSGPSTAFRPIEESSASKLEELMENCRGMELSYNFEPCILPTISGIELLMLTLVESFGPCCGLQRNC